jgi:hypothetical protein
LCVRLYILFSIFVCQNWDRGGYDYIVKAMITMIVECYLVHPLADVS